MAPHRHVHSRGHPWCTALLTALSLLAAGSGCVQRVPAPVAGAVPSPRRTPHPPSAVTEITFAYWALAPREINTVHALVQQFEQQEPTVRVRLIEVTDRYYDKLATMFAARAAPDVFTLNYGRLGDFARQGLLADLAPLVSRSPTLARAQFVRAAYDSFAGVGLALGRPGVFALPRDWGPTNLLVFNKDALDAAGVPYPTGSWTWQEFAAACRKLTIHRPGAATRQYGAAICLYPYAIAGWVFQNGGDFLSADGARSTLAGAQVCGAVQFLKRLVDEGVVAPVNAAQDQSAEQFQTGKVAMALVAPYSLGEFARCERLRWGLAPPVRGIRQATGCIPTGIAVSAQSGQRAAAVRFITFWVTVGAQRVEEAGFCVPAWRPALESASLAAGFGREAAAVLRAAAIDARPHPISRHVPYEVMLTQLKQALEAVFARGEAPAAALRAAQDRIDATADSARKSADGPNG